MRQATLLIPNYDLIFVYGALSLIKNYFTLLFPTNKTFLTHFVLYSFAITRAWNSGRILDMSGQILTDKTKNKIKKINGALHSVVEWVWYQCKRDVASACFSTHVYLQIFRLFL